MKIEMKNIYLNTIKDVYIARRAIGYTIIDTESVFVILWNTAELSFFNAAHIDKITDKKLEFLKNNFKKYPLSVVVYDDKQITDTDFTFIGTSKIMSFENRVTPSLHKQVEVKPVSSSDDIGLFCEIVGECFESKQYILDYKKSFMPDLQLTQLRKYIAYKDGLPVGALEMDAGSEATLISWVCIKPKYRRQGLCREMLKECIWQENLRGCNKFVLAADETSEKVYKNFGFKTILIRYNYKLTYND